MWTIGYGHTGPEVHKGLIITREKAAQLFANDCVWAQLAVSNAIHQDLTQNQFDAMASLAYNIGAPRFADCEVVKFTNQGKTEEAAKAFMNWIKPNLYERRMLEAALYSSAGLAA